VTELEEKIRWQISVALDRPSNYERRVNLAIDDVLELLERASHSARTDSD
jgi:hypothetical protein